MPTFKVAVAVVAAAGAEREPLRDGDLVEHPSSTLHRIGM